ncbi:hypothetical protein C1645_840604 [Glomus cerebriforme]|uniref:Uncharacterized protein n=1 Tax=Glomus cerebriforme TaxID=658196 RepID=A0A397RZ60_9GLOM|nr:hypothetical protein C1645_840604 [Glomus cerebriforme]
MNEYQNNREAKQEIKNSLDRFQAELEKREEIAKIETTIKTKTEHSDVTGA